MERSLGSLHLDAVQGAGEARTELYLRYCERALEPATKQCAKSAALITGSASEQVGAVREP